MRKTLRGILVVVAVTLLAAVGAYAQAKPATVTCVGLYSETDAGTISYRVGQGAWVVVKVGDKIPANAEIRVNVDRDWVELSPAGNPNAVYEIAGQRVGRGAQEGGRPAEGKAEAGRLSEGDARTSPTRSSRTSWWSPSTWAGRST